MGGGDRGSGDRRLEGVLQANSRPSNSHFNGLRRQPQLPRNDGLRQLSHGAQDKRLAKLRGKLIEGTSEITCILAVHDEPLGARGLQARPFLRYILL